MSDGCCGHDDDEAAPTRLWEVRALRRAAVAGGLLGVGLVSAALDADALATAAFLVAIVVGGSTFVPEAVEGLRERRLGVDLLMTVAAVGAVILGELGEAASLCFLYSISEGLEGYALARTRRGLRALLALAPERAMVERDGIETEVDPADLAPGDRLVVRPGERIATDGRVLQGFSSVDTSAVTGESMPLEVGPGSVVYAATVNGSGALAVEVTAATTDNSLARVVRQVELAQERKGSAQRLAERVARPLVPGVLVVAAGVALLGSVLGDPSVWVERALVVLVAAAPCALAIAVPVTVIAAIGAASRRGLLIKGGLALEAFAGVRTIALDKTGTLTRNRPLVVDVAPVPGVDRRQLIELAAALESRSEHPLAAAIVAAAGGRRPSPAHDVTAVPGSGIVGTLDERQVRVGKPGFVPLEGELLARAQEMQAAGASVVGVEVDGAVLGVIAVRDELRPEARSTITELRRLGYGPLVMLTGDNRATAKALGDIAGLDHVAAELLPLDKARAVEQLRSRGPTAMVGDGINDAPALATADVGIAMGAMGADVAIETADIALLGDDLTALPVAARHIRRTMRIVTQNLVLSAAILVILVPLAATGVLGLAAVVSAHELAEVVVIANGVRAGRVTRR